MSEATDRSQEFVLPKRVWLLFLLTPSLGPLVGYCAIWFVAVAAAAGRGFDLVAAAAAGFDLSPFLQGALLAYALGLVPAIMSVLLTWLVVISSQTWSVRLSLSLLCGFFATALYAVMLGSRLHDGADAIFIGGAIGALAQITCVVLWRRLGGG